VNGADIENISINAYEHEKAVYREVLPRGDETRLPVISRGVEAHDHLHIYLLLGNI